MILQLNKWKKANTYIHSYILHTCSHMHAGAHTYPYLKLVYLSYETLQFFHIYRDFSQLGYHGIATEKLKMSLLTRVYIFRRVSSYDETIRRNSPFTNCHMMKLYEEIHHLLIVIC